MELGIFTSLKNQTKGDRMFRELKKRNKRKRLKKQGIDISRNTIISRETIFEPPVRIHCNLILGNVKIGRYTYMGTGQIENAEIGRFCSIASNVHIGASTHPLNWLSTHPFQYKQDLFKTPITPLNFHGDQKTIIGNDVWLGSGVIVKCGIVIGDGAVIGAGSIVTKDIPAYAIVAGNPAKLIRYRFSDEIIQKLLKLKWWDLPIELLENVDFDNIDKALQQLEEITNV